MSRPISELLAEYDAKPFAVFDRRGACVACGPYARVESAFLMADFSRGPFAHKMVEHVEVMPGVYRPKVKGEVILR